MLKKKIATNSAHPSLNLVSTWSPQVSCILSLISKL